MRNLPPLAICGLFNEILRLIWGMSVISCDEVEELAGEIILGAVGD